VRRKQSLLLRSNYTGLSVTYLDCQLYLASVSFLQIREILSAIVRFPSLYPPETSAIALTIIMARKAKEENVIQQRQKGRQENFFDNLEAKYAGGKKPKRRAVDEPAEEAFQKNAAIGKRKHRANKA